MPPIRKTSASKRSSASSLTGLRSDRTTFAEDTILYQYLSALPKDPTVPEGFECLQIVDRLVVYEEIAAMEVFFGFKIPNKYRIHMVTGEQICIAMEKSRGWMISSYRAFCMEIKTNQGKTISEFHRPFRCYWCCSPCCLQKMFVYAPPQTLLGTISQIWSCIKPEFKVENEQSTKIMIIKGPWKMYPSPKFKVFEPDGKTLIGSVQRRWCGVFQDYVSKADNFAIRFPMEMSVKQKILLIGASFLINYLYFETGSKTPLPRTQDIEYGYTRHW